LQLISELEIGPLHWFANWPTGNVPKQGAIVYTVWDRKGRFIYVGMSGRNQSGPPAYLAKDLGVVSTLMPLGGEVETNSVSTSATGLSFSAYRIGLLTWQTARYLSILKPVSLLGMSWVSGGSKLRAESTP